LLISEWLLKTLVVAVQKVTPGDIILLRRGDIFRESVEILTKNIEVNAYGQADKPLPVISGAIQITGFKPFRDNIYVAETDTDIGYLFVENELMTIARYPNEGWLRTTYWEDTRIPENATAEQLAKPNSIIDCQELTQFPNNSNNFWVGANIRWRHHSWWFETREVVGYDPTGRLYINDRSFLIREPRKGAQKGWGFYLDNKLELLDSPGEWYFDKEQKRVYLYPKNEKNPNELLVEGSVISKGLYISDGVVQNIRFQHQQDMGLEIDGVSIVQYCEFEGIGRDAKVSERGAGGAALHAKSNVRKSRISHNTFENNYNKAIDWWQNPDDTTGSVIERNIVNNTGVVPGYGGSGSWHAVAILIGRGRHVHVQYNEINSSGYVGILFGSEGNFAEYNVINNAMCTLNDGGAIYTNCSRSTIRYNIITNTRGGLESSGSWANISHGIWPEFLREYRETIIEYNTVTGSGGDGIFLPNNYNCIVRNNICYNNERYQFLVIGHEGRGQLNIEQNHLISGNVFYAAKPTQNTIYFDDRNDYGTMKDNYYFKPFSDKLIHEGKNWPGMGVHEHFTLEEWQEKFEWADTSPKTDFQKTIGAEKDNSEIFTNDTEKRKTIWLNGKWRNLNGEAVTGSFILEPFTSRILIKEGS
jgi:parallel beta-helix repeat protein